MKFLSIKQKVLKTKALTSVLISGWARSLRFDTGGQTTAGQCRRYRWQLWSDSFCYDWLPDWCIGSWQSSTLSHPSCNQQKAVWHFCAAFWIKQKSAKAASHENQECTRWRGAIHQNNSAAHALLAWRELILPLLSLKTDVQHWVMTDWIKTLFFYFDDRKKKGKEWSNVN